MLNSRSDGRMVSGLRKVLTTTNPNRLKLSPETVMGLMRGAGPGEVDVVELGKERNKHISFNGVPIILSLKLSHRQRRMMMGEPVSVSRKMAEC